MIHKFRRTRPIPLLLLLSATSQAHTPLPDARVFFIGLGDGAVVESPFRVRFGIEGFGITPAGSQGKSRHPAGQHPLLIDVEQFLDLDQPLPRDGRHLHFDNGETEAVLELPSGTQRLQPLLGDGDHELHDSVQRSEKITLEVK